MKNEKGITMLVLILTIVVLLILAGVTISYIVGDEGTVAQSSDASFEAELNQIMEQLHEKETLYELEENRFSESLELSDAEKQAILSSRYNIYDSSKSSMDIECREISGEIKLILKYNPSEFNSRQIKLLQQNKAEEIVENTTE